MDPINKEDEEDEEARRCRLDKGLFALLYHELMSSRFDATAKKLLKEAGVESVELAQGVPPRLRDLVDVWNEVQTVPPAKVFPSRALVPGSSLSSSSAHRSYLLSQSSYRRTASPVSTSSMTKTSSSQTYDDDSTVVASGSASSGAAASSSAATAASGGESTEGTQRMRSGIYGMYLPPVPVKKNANAKDDWRNKSNKGTRGPWLNQEEQVLKEAIQLYGDSNLELIYHEVKSRSVKGIAKHLMKTKKGWGPENNRRIFDVLVGDSGMPTLDQLLAVKPADKSEKDLINLLEWFIVHNNSYHPKEQFAIDEKEKLDLARMERERLEREICLEAHPNILDEAVVPLHLGKNPHALAYLRMTNARDNAYSGTGGNGGDAYEHIKRARLEITPWTPEEDETIKRLWEKYRGDARRIHKKMSETRTYDEVTQRLTLLQETGAIAKEESFLNQPAITAAFHEPTLSSEGSNRQFIIRWTPDEIKAFARVYAHNPANIDALCSAVPRRTRGAVIQRLKDITEGRITLDGEVIEQKNS